MGSKFGQWENRIELTSRLWGGGGSVDVKQTHNFTGPI